MKISVETNSEMPAFAAFYEGSVKEGTPLFAINVPAFLYAVAEGDMEPRDCVFHFAETLFHEFIHALQEHFTGVCWEEGVQEFVEKLRDGRIELEKSNGE